MTPGFMVAALAVAAGGPRVDAPDEPIDVGGAVVLALSGGGLILIDSCAPVELEQKVDDRWVALPPSACASAQPATVVDGSLTLTVPAPPAGQYRAAVAWGSGCVAKLPFHLSSCKKLGVARSGEIRVGSETGPASPDAGAVPPAPVPPPQSP